MNDVEIIGLSGPANSGKDYLAEHVLVDEYNCIPLSLARWFKIEGVLFYDQPRDEIFGDSEYSDSTREWLQLRGTEQGRWKHGKDVWCRALEMNIQALNNNGIERFVVTDVRFPNECEWIQGLGGHVFRVIGRGGETVRDHKSENALDSYDGFDGYIDNSEHRSEAVFEDLRRYARGVFGVQ